MTEMGLRIIHLEGNSLQRGGIENTPLPNLFFLSSFLFLFLFFFFLFLGWIERRLEWQKPLPCSNSFLPPPLPPLLPILSLHPLHFLIRDVQLLVKKWSRMWPRSTMDLLGGKLPSHCLRKKLKWLVFLFLAFNFVLLNDSKILIRDPVSFANDKRTPHNTFSPLSIPIMVYFLPPPFLCTFLISFIPKRWPPLDPCPHF